MCQVAIPESLHQQLLFIVCIIDQIIMNLTSSLCVILFLGAFGSVACGKAVGPDELVQAEADNPCVYKGKIFTIDVRKIANRFKYVQSLF